MAPKGSNALEGLRVLEISAAGNWAASLLGMLLADQGAFVARVGVHPDHAPIEERAAARARSREARSRAGIDRNKHVLAPIATPADVVRLVACADVVILSYATELPELDPVTIRTQHPSLLLVTMCEFDKLQTHPPDDGRVGAATGLFTDMNLYDRLFEPGDTKYTRTPLPSTYAAIHAASAVCLGLGRRASSGRGRPYSGLAGGLFLPGADSTPDQWVPGQQTCPGLAPLDPAGVFRNWLEQMIADKRMDLFARTWDCADGPSKLQVMIQLTETQACHAARHGALGRSRSRRRHQRTAISIDPTVSGFAGIGSSRRCWRRRLPDRAPSTG